MIEAVAIRECLHAQTNGEYGLKLFYLSFPWRLPTTDDIVLEPYLCLIEVTIFGVTNVG